MQQIISLFWTPHNLHLGSTIYFLDYTFWLDSTLINVVVVVVDVVVSSFLVSVNSMLF